MSVRVGILDYSISNLASVLHAFRHLGAQAEVVQTADDFANFTHLVLPGVGSFAAGMANLQEANLIEPVRSWAASGKPLLGLCLGMQLLADESEEFGPTKGLGILPGRIVRVRPASKELRLPHVGWNAVERRGQSQLLDGLDDPMVFYFVHSYCYENPDTNYVVGVFEYGGPQVAVVEHGNIFGAQFHPEKSQKTGLTMLENFVATPRSDA